jgi:hypothetical protein
LPGISSGTSIFFNVVHKTFFCHLSNQELAKWYKGSEHGTFLLISKKDVTAKLEKVTLVSVKTLMH